MHKVGEHLIIDRFNAYNTSTQDSLSIVKYNTLSEQIDAYKKYVESISKDVEIPIYHKDDFFNCEKPIGYETVNCQLPLD